MYLQLFLNYFYSCTIICHILTRKIPSATANKWDIKNASTKLSIKKANRLTHFLLEQNPFFLQALDLIV